MENLPSYSSFINSPRSSEETNADKLPSYSSFVNGAEKSEEVGIVHGIARGLKSGLTQDLPSAAGKALQFVGAEEAGKALTTFAEQNAVPEDQQGFWEKGARTIGAVLPMILAGAAGNVAGVVAGVAGGAIFGLSQAHETEKALKERGIEPGMAPYLTGGATAAAMTLLPIMTGRIFNGPIANLVGKELSKQTAESVIRPSAGKILQDYGIKALETQLIFAGQTLSVAGIEKAYGVPREIASEMLESAKTGIAFSAFAAPGMAIRRAVDSSHLKTLANPWKSEDVAAMPADLQGKYLQRHAENRSGYAEAIGNALEKGGDPDTAKLWHDYAYKQIEKNEPIDTGMTLDAINLKAKLLEREVLDTSTTIKKGDAGENIGEVLVEEPPEPTPEADVSKTILPVDETLVQGETLVPPREENVAPVPEIKAERPVLTEEQKKMAVDAKDAIFKFEGGKSGKKEIKGKIAEIQAANPGLTVDQIVGEYIKGLDVKAKAVKAEVPLEPDRRADNIQRKLVSEMTPDERATALLTDHLTGQRNKRAYEETERKPYQVSLDVDGLKYVNDTFGHEAGNELLQTVGNALNRASGGKDNYHFHGDEFALEGKTPTELAAVVEKARQILRDEPLTFGDGKYTADFSHGIAETMAKADKAMQANKAERKVERGAAPKGIEKAEPGAKVEGKQPWEMTRDEWRANKPDTELVGQKKIEYDNAWDFKRLNSLKQALSESKPVPPEVLKDYPDLAKQIVHETTVDGVKVFKGEKRGNLDIGFKPKEVTAVFNDMVKSERDALDNVLYNWQEVRLNEDGTKLTAHVGREGERAGTNEFNKKYTPSRKEFLEWLNSDEPFNTKIYGEGIKTDKEWISDIQKLRNKAQGRESAEPEIKKPTTQTEVRAKIADDRSLAARAFEITEKEKAGTVTPEELSERQKIREKLGYAEETKEKPVRTKEDIQSELDDRKQELEDYTKDLADAEGDKEEQSSIRENIRDTKAEIAVLTKELKPKNAAELKAKIAADKAAKEEAAVVERKAGTERMRERLTIITEPEHLDYVLSNFKDRLADGEGGGKKGTKDFGEDVWLGSGYPDWYQDMVTRYGSKKTSPILTKNGKAPGVDADRLINIIDKGMKGKELTQGYQQQVWEDINRIADREAKSGEYQGVLDQIREETNEWTGEKARLTEEGADAGAVEAHIETATETLRSDLEAKGYSPEDVETVIQELKNEALKTKETPKGEYNLANDAFKEVADRYEIARDQYRNKEINDNEFLVVKKEYDQAQKDFDVAFAKEQKKPTPKGDFKNAEIPEVKTKEDILSNPETEWSKPLSEQEVKNNQELFGTKEGLDKVAKDYADKTPDDKVTVAEDLLKNDKITEEKGKTTRDFCIGGK